MARPERNNVDYFPFICKYGKTMRFIEGKYGNDGFATWIKILRELAVTDFHYLHLSDKMDLMDLASICKVDEDKLLNIINDLCEYKQFQKQLWEENKVLFSEKFIINIRDAYKKRRNGCITLDGLLHLLNDLGIRKLYKPLREVPLNPHTIVEYSKEDNSKEKYVYTLPEVFTGKALEDLFSELQNHTVLDTIAGNNGVTREKVAAIIPEFKKTAELTYNSRKDFITHFKNSVPKILKTQAVDNSQPTVKRNQPAGRK